MLDHISLQADDSAAAAAFYLEVFASLGFREVMRFDSPAGPVVGFSDGGDAPAFWIGPTIEESHREAHVAFRAPDRGAVDAVHQAAVAHGVEILHGPREFPEYHPGYYAVMFRDLDGNNVEAVCHH
jgi:catechol 2,3-dioxygenase-like lactoylglutathione lyase family enzyme